MKLFLGVALSWKWIKNDALARKEGRYDSQDDDKNVCLKRHLNSFKFNLAQALFTNFGHILYVLNSKFTLHNLIPD